MTNLTILKSLWHGSVITKPILLQMLDQTTQIPMEATIMEAMVMEVTMHKVELIQHFHRQATLCIEHVECISIS